MKKGIFWCVAAESAHPKLITVSVSCDPNGNPDTPVMFSSKAGTSFNHKAEWEKLDKSIRGGVPYNYYPRGRVETRKGKATVYLNPDINREDIIQIVFEVFTALSVSVWNGCFRESSVNAGKEFGYGNQKRV